MITPYATKIMVSSDYSYRGRNNVVEMLKLALCLKYAISRVETAVAVLYTVILACLMLFGCYTLPRTLSDWSHLL